MERFDTGVEPISGFDAPRPPQDGPTADLYNRHGLGEAPSLADIEPVATELLGDPSTLLDGVSLILGRRVDAKEIQAHPELGMALLVGQHDPKQSFGLMLLARDTIFRQPTETPNE